MNSAIAAALCIALSLPAMAETVAGDSIIVLDGDTVELPCQPAGCRHERIRLLNIDAPETTGAVCRSEYEAGEAARDRLIALIAGRPVHITRCEDPVRCKDRYGRTLARIATSTGDVGQQLMAEGHALHWRAGRSAKFQRQMHWCRGGE